MNTDNRFLLFFFLCWAILYSPLSVLSAFWEKDDFVAVEDCGGAGVVKGSVRAGDFLVRDKGLLCGDNGCGWMIYDGVYYYPFSGQFIVCCDQLGDMPDGLFPFERPFVLKPKNPE